MRVPPTNCPVCNAMERFARKERRIGDRLYVYMVCHTCRTEFPIGVYTPEQERQQKRAERERRRALRANQGLHRAGRSGDDDHSPSA
jgi:ribosomal protein L37AE/L43A